MKPIKLVIKGINSFEETQEIDFEKLTSRGIFGIFGPTGSGKSSILDGMTLALYGDVARASSNFINVNMEKASVEFTFLIREGQPRIYCVSRTFRRDKKTDGMRTESARILEWQQGESVELAKIVAEQKNEVDKECRKIIGLSKDDFFRTVVLPQGKFSEFLKLEGAERSKMLERLFHLEKYGELLTARTKKRQSLLEGNLRELTGQMSAYGEVSEEAIKELKKEEREKNQLQKEASEELAKIREEKNRLEQLRRLQKELEVSEEERKKAEENRIFIEEKEKQWNAGDKAWRLYDSFQAVKRAETEKTEGIQAFYQEEKNFQLLKEKTDLQEARAEESGQAAREQIPLLEQQEGRLKEAVLLQKEMISLKEETEGLNRQQKEFLSAKEELEGNLKTLNQQVNHAEERSREADKRQKENFISQEEQQKIDRAMRLFEENSRLTEEMEALADRFRRLGNEEELEKELLELSKKHRCSGEEEKRLEESAILLKEKQVDRDVLIEQQNRWKDAKAEQDRQMEYQGELEEKRKEKLAAEAAEKLAFEKKNEADSRRRLAEEQYEKLYEGSLAEILSERLEEGKPCPVCGSIHHVRMEGKMPSGSEKELQQAKKQREQARKELEEAEKSCQKVSAEKQLLEQSIKGLLAKLAALNPELLQVSLEEEKKNLWQQKYLQDEINEKLEELAKRLEKQRKETAELFSGCQVMTTKLENLKQQRRELAKEQKEKAEKQEQVKKALENCQQETGIFNCRAAWEEKQQKNRAYEEAAKHLEASRKELDGLKDKKSNMEKVLSEAEHRIALTEQQLETGRKLLKEKETHFLEKTREGFQAGETVDLYEDLQERIEIVRLQITQLDEKRNTDQVLFMEMQQKLETSKKHLETLKDNRLRLETREEELKKQLEDAMKKEQVSDRGWIEENYRPLAELSREREELDAFYQKVKELEVKIQHIRELMQGQTVSEEQWQQMESREKALSGQLSQYQTELGNIKGRLEKLQTDWETLKELQSQKNSLEHKMAVVEDLLQLLKGKQFVNYISRYYLEYISIEANRRLKDMTGGTYGLETNSQGKFLIRDYKNGGILRDASTLSGGETFMASLALALSLSSQIQLKGAAPLELFFLDEGFGTLDEKYLDVVMSSLEKIHNDRLNVGLITHVEEIKERIGMRLMVHPAEIGKGGSKVKIETE